MASSPTSTGATMGVKNPNEKKTLGFVANAIKRKHSFIQFFAMTGILMLSIRSLGQKYRVNDLVDDTTALREEQQGLVDRMKKIKQSLLHEASADSTGAYAARLRLLFGDDER